MYKHEGLEVLGDLKGLYTESLEELVSEGT